MQAQGIRPKKSSFFESTLFVRRQVRVCNFNNNAKKVLGSIQESRLRLLECDQSINWSTHFWIRHNFFFQNSKVFGRNDFSTTKSFFVCELPNWTPCPVDCAPSCHSGEVQPTRVKRNRTIDGEGSTQISRFSFVKFHI